MALLFADPGGKFFTATQVTQGLYTSFANATFVSSGIPAGAIESVAYAGSTTSNPQFGIACPNGGAGPYTMGIRYYAPAAGGLNMNFNDTANPQVTLQSIGNNQFQVLRSNNTVLQTSTFVMNVASWNYIEFQCFCHPSLGTYAVRVNNQVIMSATNQNTQGQGSTLIGRFNASFGLSGVFYQDIYLVDNTTSPLNTLTGFAGDCSMPVLYANRNGAFTQYAPTGAAQPFQCVADVTPDDATTFVSDGTVGDRCSFGYGSVASSNPVVGVMHVSRILKSDSGTRTVSQTLTSNGVDAIATAIAPGTSYAYALQPLTLDPSTNVPFTVNGVNALQGGLKTIS